MTQIINRDFMNSLNPEDVIQASLQQLEKTQYEKPELQSVAFAVTLLAYCRRHSIETGDAFTVANNILHSKQARESSYQALANYMQHEL